MCSDFHYHILLISNVAIINDLTSNGEITGNRKIIYYVMDDYQRILYLLYANSFPLCPYFFIFATDHPSMNSAHLVSCFCLNNISKSHICQ